MTERTIKVDFFDSPDSHFGGRAEAELLKLSCNLNRSGIKLIINRKNTRVQKNRKELEKYIASFIKKKFNPHYPLIVPLVVYNGKPIFLGYNPKMQEMIKNKIL